MAQIKILNVPKAGRQMLREYAVEYARLLNLKGLIVVQHDDELKSLGCAEHMAKGIYRIGLNLKLGNVATMLQTLGHEMLHVQQYAKGILKLADNGDITWKGKAYPLKKRPEYHRQPWEISVMRRETILFYTAEHNINSKG